MGYETLHYFGWHVNPLLRKHQGKVQWKISEQASIVRSNKD